jgi:drug/metabolite transporter (DMT)-like permease
MRESEVQPWWNVVVPGLFVVLWSTGFLVARLSAGHVDPFTFLSLRFPIAGLVFATVAVVQHARWPSPRLAGHAMVAGALLHGGYLGPIYWAVAHGMPAGVSALIVGLQPLITAFLAALVLKEAISLRHWVGLLVGVAGVALVLWPKLALSGTHGITPVTIAMNVLGAFGVSLGTVYQKRFATGLALASGGAWQYVGATLTVLAAAALMENFHFDGSFNAWFALGWSVIVLSIVAISLLMLMIRHGAVARVSSLIFLVPAVSALMAYVIFDEHLVWIQILGMATCAIAVFIVTRKR